MSPRFQGLELKPFLGPQCELCVCLIYLARESGLPQGVPESGGLFLESPVAPLTSRQEPTYS